MFGYKDSPWVGKKQTLPFVLGREHTPYNMTCKGNLCLRLSSTIDCWPSSGSDWSDLVEDLDASCLPSAQQTGLVDQTAYLGYFEGGCLFWGDVDGKNFWCAPLATDLQWEMPTGNRITTYVSSLVPAEVAGEMSGLCHHQIMKRDAPQQQLSWEDLAKQCVNGYWQHLCNSCSLTSRDKGGPHCPPGHFLEGCNLRAVDLYDMESEALGGNYPPSENIIYVYLYWICLRGKVVILLAPWSISF